MTQMKKIGMRALILDIRSEDVPKAGIGLIESTTAQDTIIVGTSRASGLTAFCVMTKETKSFLPEADLPSPNHRNIGNSLRIQPTHHPQTKTMTRARKLAPLHLLHLPNPHLRP
jgi:hypothetical protein